MICPRSNCKMSFERPLELFNGRWFCPYCGENIFPDEQTELQITAENHVKLINSEKIFYKDWLLNEKNKDENQKAVDLKKAIALCSESAFLNNPYALINMGFYYENGYIDLHRSYWERLRVAYMYYNAVCFNKTKNIKIFNNNQNNEQTLNQKESDDLKKHATFNLYSLLNKIPKSKEKEVLGDAVRLKDKVKDTIKLLKQYGVENLDKITIEEASDSLSLEMLLSIICQPQRMNREPLFGIFRLTKADIIKLTEKTYKNLNGIEKSLSDHIMEGKTKIKIAKAMSKVEANEFKPIKNANEINSLVNEGDEDSEYFLFFFNNNCQTEYFKKSALKKIYDNLTKNFDEELMMFVNKGLVNRYVFGADDIYKFYNQKNNYSEAINSLYEYCIEG